MSEETTTTEVADETSEETLAGGSGDVAPLEEGVTLAGGEAVQADEDGSDHDGGEGDATQSGDDADGESTGAPEGGYAEFTVAEGAPPLDEETLGEFKTIATDANLSQEAAQQLVDLGQKQVAKAIEMAYGQMETEFQAQQKAWQGEMYKHPSLGGTNMPATVETVRKGVGFAGEQAPALRAWLNDSGLGNHPLLVEYFHKVGQALSDDAMEFGNQSSQGEQVDGARRMFPNERGDQRD